MPLSTAREIERYYFEQFRKHFPVPDGQVIYADKPDVRVHGDRTLGVEIVRLYLTHGGNPESEQRQSALRSQVLAKAQELHEERGERKIELHIDFDPATPITDVQDAAKRLAHLARQIQHELTLLSGHSTEIRHGLRFVYHNAIAYPDAKWRNIQSYAVNPVNPDRLRVVVDEKIAKAKQYEACDELWLLIIVDFMDRAQDQDLTLPDDLKLSAKPFDRVLLYKPQFRQVVEVPQ
jgi:hypothetical protein